MSGSPGERECVVVFVRSGVEARARSGCVLLDLEMQVGVAASFSCREGTCATCATRILSGEAEVETTMALSENQRRTGWILMCSARTKPGRLVLDA